METFIDLIADIILSIKYRLKYRYQELKYTAEFHKVVRTFNVLQLDLMCKYHMFNAQNFSVLFKTFFRNRLMC